MDWQRALDEVVARTGHERFRALCADSNPDAAQRAAYRDTVLRMAGGAPAADPEANPTAYPSWGEQAANFAGAVGRAAAAAVRGEDVLVPDAEYEERLATCRACEFFDAGAGRCRACGCITVAKARLATERCPKRKWPGES